MAVRVSASHEMISRGDGDGFGGLVTRPQNTTFATQDADEEIYIIARRDIISNLGWISTAAIMAVIPALIVLFAANFNIALSEFTPLRYQIFALTFYYSFVFTYIIANLSDWYYNVLIVTNKRILNYTFKLFSSKKVSEADLDKIEDVSQMTVGVLPVFFDYGDLFIQTAGQKTKFLIRSVPRPTWLRNVLVDLSRLTTNPEP
jgi:hypothetical protein